MPKTKTFPTESKRRPLIREKPAPIAYRINDAAEAIGIGRAKLYQLIAAGKIPAKKCDGLTFIRAVDLDAYISGGEDVGPISSMQDIDR
ncbi:helix-turn-helix domain-containing protein [Methylobacterium sp. J-078]|uniref:helix-turn-helix domain-containing protein n=1 Tax=Methylobacterium sp. J-078 TaxID=2836657 RepID=UPI001FB8CEA2|nr:helix-turn-helix domain-containing protein [Methylobacterium sp. J-078]MCJ2043788.1 helix-turn-helix domain-containing protein [Methylobacterium sp. J-078]